MERGKKTRKGLKNVAIFRMIRKNRAPSLTSLIFDLPMRRRDGEIPVGVVPQGHGFPLKLPLPTTLIGRLAVDRAVRGRGLGSDLLVHAIRVAAKQSKHVASAVIEVDAIDDDVRSFYQKFGFAELPDDARHLYLPMADAKRLVDETF